MVIENRELNQIRANAQDATIALRLGCYDLLHEGHQASVDVAAAGADIVVIGVMSDARVTEKKGLNRPINPQYTRVEAIDAAPGVDYSFIVPKGRRGVASSFLRLRPDMYVEEGEYASKPFKAAFLYAVGIELVLNDQTRLCSTSAMIANLGLARAVANASLTYSNRSIGR